MHLKFFFFVVIIISFPFYHYGQERTVGLIKNEIVDPGYILFNPLSNKTTYLINREGQKVVSWTSDYVPGMTAYLKEDGTLYRAGRVTDDTYINSGGAGGIIERFNWEGEVIWQYRYASPLFRQHHDFEILPNGNILLLAWEKKTAEEAVMAGRDPNSLGTDQLWPDHLVEIQPEDGSGGKIVWEWHVWDHLVQDINPSLENYGDISDPTKINLNHYQNKLADWIHGNALEYNEALDQIMISSRGFNEVWIIDHSTSTEEARGTTGGRSGKGGSLLWRWGNPVTYQQPEPQQLFGQHGIDWQMTDTVGKSRVFIYNNGNGRRPDIYSTIDIVDISYSGTGQYPLMPQGHFAPSTFTSSFSPEDSLTIYAPLFSNVQRMEDDRILVCVGPRGTFIEFDSGGNEVWKYINPVTESGRILNQGESIGNYQSSVNSVFSINYYPLHFPAFEGKDLMGGEVIEGEMVTAVDEKQLTVNIFPNPVKSHFYFQGEAEELRIFNLRGQLLKQINSITQRIDVSDLTPGTYLCQIDRAFTLKLVIIK